jgi:multiple sugar transport system permease protein
MDPDRDHDDDLDLVRPDAAQRKKDGDGMKRILLWWAERALLVLVSVIVLFPIAWMFLTAFKSPRDAYSLSLNFTPTLNNFVTVFSDPWNLQHMVLNSVIVASVTVLIAVPCASLAAYSFSRFRVKGRKFLFFLVLSTQFIPAVVIVLPFFLMFRQLGLLDTRIALIIVNLAIVTPFVIWMIKGYIDAIPTDSEEAAMIDGASRLRVIRDIVLPVAAPGILTSSIFCFILTWNEFLFSLILTRRDAVTLPVGLVNFRTERGDLWELMSAAGVMITVPIFIMALLIQKHFTRGMTAGAVK